MANAIVATQQAQRERERQQRLKLKRKLKEQQQQQQQQRKQQEKPAAAKQKLDTSGAHKRKAELPGHPKLKRLGKKGAPEQAQPMRGNSSDELEDLPLAKRVRREDLPLAERVRRGSAAHSRRA